VYQLLEHACGGGDISSRCTCRLPGSDPFGHITYRLRDRIVRPGAGRTRIPGTGGVKYKSD